MGNSTYTDEEKNLKNSYYKLIGKTLKDRYKKNRFDKFNQNYSLFAKDFEKSYINQKIIHSKLANYYISWKSYLLNALNNMAKEEAYTWAGNLCETISNESFPNQTKYQNMFFYQELQILSKPKLKNNSLSSLERTTYFPDFKKKDITEKIEDSFAEKDDKFDPKDPMYSIKMKISNNLMGSFVSADSDSPNSSLRKDPNYEYQYNKNKIKEYMEIFKEHLSLKDHPIYYVINSFINEFVPVIKGVNESYKNNLDPKNIGCDDKAKDVIKQLQNFIVLMQNVIKLFYSRSISYEYFRDEKDEFLNLVSYIIFSSVKIYEAFFQLFQFMNKDNIEKFEKKHEILGDITPEEIGIKDRFCLNEKTNIFMEELKTKKKNTKIYNKNGKNNEEEDNTELAININGKEKIIDINDDNNIDTSSKKNQDNNINTDELKLKVDLNRNNSENLKVTSDSGKLNIITREFSLLSKEKEYSKTPYGEAIEFIKKIVEFKVPLEKLVIIASVSSLITQSVNKYWRNMARYIEPSMLSIDADELMTIFMYIIYKSNMPLLFVHADFIKYFTSPTTKSTMIGYYYTTLQGCLDFLLEINDKGDFTKESN
jgi:hypothetical protein